MALVDYSDSEASEKESSESKGHTTDAVLKRKRSDSAKSDLPPLPDSFLDLYASSSRVGTQDDPSLHGGRQRMIPHIEGNWPTHVYIEWYPSHTESSQLSRLLEYLNDGLLSKDKVQGLLESDLGAEMPLHISLSRSIMLVTDQRQAFGDLVRECLSKSGIRPFDVSVIGYEWVPNYEKTRWFLVMQLMRPSNDGLNRLLQVCNHVSEVFGHPPLYVPRQAALSRLDVQSGGRRGRARRSHRLPSRTLNSHQTSFPTPEEDASSRFHVSVGWVLEQPSHEAVDKLKSADADFMANLRLTVNSIKVKIGNSVTSVSLPIKVEEHKGIIGL